MEQIVEINAGRFAETFCPPQKINVEEFVFVYSTADTGGPKKRGGSGAPDKLLRYLLKQI